VPAPLIVFRNLPGIELLESEQMIAEKFHQQLPQSRIDSMSRAIFGTIHSEIGFEVPEWFTEGFDSFEEWKAAPTVDDDCECLADDSGEQEDGGFKAKEESPQRQELRRQAMEFAERMQVDADLRDDYDLVHYAKSFGFDFSDHTGQHPLRVTRLFFRQALAAARGVMGHLPDVSVLGTQEWGQKLEEEARRFRRRAGHPR
jgi:hypothetical protein